MQRTTFEYHLQLLNKTIIKYILYILIKPVVSDIELLVKLKKLILA